MKDSEEKATTKDNGVLYQRDLDGAAPVKNAPSACGEKVAGGVGVPAAATNSPVAIYSDAPKKKSSASGGTEETGARRRAMEEIYRERRRQLEVEGFDTARDDGYRAGELAFAAMCYCMPAALAAGVEHTEEQYRQVEPLVVWPWHQKWWKPKNPRRDLIRAAALIVAEIERLDRKAVKHERSVCDSAQVGNPEAAA